MTATARKNSVVSQADLLQASRMVEALLFRSVRPLSIAELAALLPVQYDAAAALQVLGERLEAKGSAVELREVRLTGGDEEGVMGWELGVCSDMARFLTHEQDFGVQKLSRESLHALAVIAFNQPVTMSDIAAAVKGLGVDLELQAQFEVEHGTVHDQPRLQDELKDNSQSKGGYRVDGTVLQPLLDAGWIQIVGYKRGHGRPALYGTTAGFLEHFGFATLADLPEAAEVDAVIKATRETVPVLPPEVSE